MTFATVADAEKALEKYYGITEKVMGKDITVGRTKKLMAHLGNPERRLRAIHVAGTSGKTSTSYYIATLLHSAGLSVGLTVSPHIDSLTERIQINDAPISDAKFCTYLAQFLALIDDIDEQPTWSECIIAFAFWVFAEEKLEYVVVETMLGGLEDATNVLARTDKLCVITDIGHDHMNILGARIEQIAYQKAGIIHDGNNALMYDQGPEIMQVVRYWASQQENAEVYPFEQLRLEKAYKGRYASNLPEYQKRNWLLAFAAYLFLARRDEFKIITEKQMQKTQHIQIPARMDVAEVAGKAITMDGAHNGQKMQAFVGSYRAHHPDEKVPVLLALKQGKEVADVAPQLAKIASEIIVTSFSQAQDLPIISIRATELAAQLKQLGHKNVRVIADQDKAYQAFIKTSSVSGIITGSFYLIAQLREKHPELHAIH